MSKRQAFYERHCQICGVRLSHYNTDNLCWPCQEARRIEARRPETPQLSFLKPRALPPHSRFTLRSVFHAVRRTKPLRNSNIGQALTAFRAAHCLTQRELAALLGFDQSYISKLESGRNLRDIAVLKEIADRLGISPEQLGLTTGDYATKYSVEMVALAPSIIRLARIAREAGRADEAINELWPLLQRLEAQVAYDEGNIPLQLAYADGQATLGVILGDLLPEEDLFMSVHFFKRAAAIVDELGDDICKVEIFRGCGNELRKNKQYPEAIEYLERALALAPDGTMKGIVAILLARTYGEMGDKENFDDVIESVLHFLDKTSDFTPSFNPITIKEVHLRGLINVGHVDRIPQWIAHNPFNTATMYPTPQWRVLSLVTLSEAMFHANKIEEGLAHIQTALVGAEVCKLPHQVQRVLRILKTFEIYRETQPLIEGAQTLLAGLSHRPPHITLSN